MSDAPAHRVLVSGANGFVGRAVVRELTRSADFEVIAAVRKMKADRENSSIYSTFDGEVPDEPTTGELTHVLIGDLSAETDWAHALIGVRTVVHLAARVHVMKEQADNPLAEFRRVNVQGTLQLARQAIDAGVKRFVYVSSVKVNGESGCFSESDKPAPTDPYGTTKLEAELALQDLARSSGLEVVIVRPPLVYGSGVKANFRSLMNLVERRVPLPFGAINNKRSFVSVDNLANFLLVCVTNPAAANQTFLVSDGHDLSTTELLQAIARAMNKPSKLISVPASLLEAALKVVGKGAIADRLMGTLCVDISKARTLLQWTPPVTVDEALRRTVAGS
ncbi:MAG: SDR family oxidoreductase [Gemmatimonadaceae bacterium]